MSVSAPLTSPRDVRAKVVALIQIVINTHMDPEPDMPPHAMLPVHLRTLDTAGLHPAIGSPFAAGWEHKTHVKPPRYTLKSVPKDDACGGQKATLVELRSPQIRMAQLRAYPEAPVHPKNAP